MIAHTAERLIGADRAVPADQTVTANQAVEIGKRRVYDAETSLHAASQSGVDAWVSAAYDRLHIELVSYEALLVCCIEAAKSA